MHLQMAAKKNLSRDQKASVRPNHSKAHFRSVLLSGVEPSRYFEFCDLRILTYQTLGLLLHSLYNGGELIFICGVQSVEK